MPDVNDGHACDDGIGILLRRRVDRVVGADDEGDVCLVKVVLDLVHLEDGIVGDARLGEEHVELPRHAPRHGVDRKTHAHACLLTQVAHLGEGVLAVGHGQTVPRDDDDILGRGEERDGGLDVGHLGLALELHGLARALGGGAQPSQHHGNDGAVHGHAHDVREDGARGADERTDDREEGLVEHEALRAQGPPRVGVEHGDDHGHVRAANGVDEVEAQHERDASHRSQRDGAQVLLRRVQVPREHAERAHEGGGEDEVERVPERQLERRGGEEACELGHGDERPCEGDAPDGRGEADGHEADHLRVLAVAPLVLCGEVDEVRDGGEHGGEADEGVEAGHRLRQRRGVHLGVYAHTKDTANGHHARKLHVHLPRPDGRDGAEGGHETEGDARHGGHVPEARRLLRREARDAADAEETGHGLHYGGGEDEASEAEGARVPRHSDDHGEDIVVEVLGRVCGAPEVVEHLAHHQ
mmetsp:Transcript_15752/g.38617  ORF Transcript_15752/g.38617 Transcript_15752/m.38617 type:complete len:470 (-) Transcript_15752:3966-5375(-)